MKEQGHCTPGVCPGTSAHGVTVSLYVHCNHPLLQLKRARRGTPSRSCGVIGSALAKTPMAALACRGMWPCTRSLGADAGEALNARAMEAYVSEGRGGTGVHWPPSRPQSPDSIIPISPGPMRPWARRASRRHNALLLQVAQDCGFADASILSSDTTAQELPIGHPNDPDLTGAQRCGRALAQLKTRGGGSRYGPGTGADDPQDSQRTPPLAKGKQAKRQVLTRLLTEVGQLIVQTRLGWSRGLARRMVTPHALTTLQTMHEVAKRLIPTDRAVDHHWRRGQGQNPPCGCDAGAGAGRPKAGKEVEFGLPYLLSRLGGGCLGR